MASIPDCSRWQENENGLIRSVDGFRITLPCEIPQSAWVDDSKLWPDFDYKDLYNFLVKTRAPDGLTMDNYKSMDSYQYFHSEKVGALLYNNPSEGLCFLKAEVKGSQTDSTRHKPWVLLTSDGVVETAGCSCIAGRGKTCSHVGAVLWKV